MDVTKEFYPMVSVYMTTYYHESYIQQAIESVLMQKTDFNFEIVISDDCSKDNTQKIISDYVNKYSFIRANFNEKNIGLSKNMFLAKTMCKGKYIIVLSGDDYWIDDCKLQKQVDFLEINPQYLGVATRLEARTNDSELRDFLVPNIRKCNRIFTLSDFLKGDNFPLNGMMMRNVIQDKYDYFAIMPKISEYIDDITDCLLILLLGDIYITDDITVAYRRRVEASGEHNFNSINTELHKLKKTIDLLNSLDNHFSGEYDLYNRYKIVLGPAFWKLGFKADKQDIKKIINTIPATYLDRKLVFNSYLYIPFKIYSVLKRKIKKEE